MGTCQFPVEGEVRGKIEISPAWFRLTEEGIRRGLEKMGIVVLPEQILKYAMRRFVAHELGHGIEKAKIFATLENENKGTRDDYFKEMERLERFIYDQASDEDLRQLLNGESETSSYTRRSFSSSERIAMGYELVEAEKALVAIGFPINKAKDVVDQLFIDRKQHMQEWRKVVDNARSKGLNVDLIGQAMFKLAEWLRYEGRRDLIDYLPNRGFGASEMGYDTPLRIEQIKQFFVENT